MGYDYTQGIAHAVAKLYDLLDNYNKSKVIPKEAIRKIIEELEEE